MKCVQGIEVGDFISFDPRNNFRQKLGLLRSHFPFEIRFLAILIHLLKVYKDGIVFLYHHFYFSKNEEIGYGEFKFPDQVVYLAADMGAMGDLLKDGRVRFRFVKDASGPITMNFVSI